MENMSGLKTLVKISLVEEGIMTNEKGWIEYWSENGAVLAVSRPMKKDTQFKLKIFGVDAEVSRHISSFDIDGMSGMDIEILAEIVNTREYLEKSGVWLVEVLFIGNVRISKNAGNQVGTVKP